MNRVLPREVAQAVKVPTTLDATEWGRDVGKDLPRVETRCICVLRGELSLCTAGNLPSMLMFRRYLSGTTIVVRGALHSTPPFLRLERVIRSRRG